MCQRLMIYWHTVSQTGHPNAVMALLSTNLKRKKDRKMKKRKKKRKRRLLCQPSAEAPSSDTAAP